jgi:branched-chain amino acid transport system substrate-binding protein
MFVPRTIGENNLIKAAVEPDMETKMHFGRRFSALGPVTFAICAACVLMVACGSDDPVRIGFIGGLTDANSDNGQAGLQGVTLAVEQFNRAGGLDGRMVEVIAKDDAQNAEIAVRATRELVAAGVPAIIGPFTSSMALAILPVTGEAGVLQVSPTITSMTFHGKDDHLFRINRTSRDNAQDYARVLTGRGGRKFAVAYDLRNRNFTESWLAEFRLALQARGAEVVVAVPYESALDRDFAPVVRDMIAAAPDALFFLSGALDVARLAQQARKQAPALPIAAAEWAATEDLIDLGGTVVDGLLIAQNFDRDDTSDRFTEFTEAYFKRFQRPPGYSSVSAYDATTVVLQALGKRRSNETMKASVLRNGPYRGLQQEIAFDANGDTTRRVYFTEVRQGRYVKAQ